MSARNCVSEKMASGKCSAFLMSTLRLTSQRKAFLLVWNEVLAQLFWKTGQTLLRVQF